MWGPPSGGPSGRSALLAYIVLALVATWPLALGLARDVPWDLGDPVFVTWVIAWDCDQLLAILTGDLGRFATFFDTNTFHPAPLTLAYSEHFLAQALQVLPVYALTKNPILSYNLLFLSTFVLSGLGAYLLVRDLTGDRRAAFLAGVLFAFSPFRLPHASHLQVLSSHWMPFVLYGLRRYIVAGTADTGGVRRRWVPLAIATAALAAQNLSSIYYLIYFSPFVAAFTIWQLTQHRQWRQWRTLAGLGIALVVVAAVTVPVMLPYVALQEGLGLVRSRGETIRYSADVYSYFTALADQPIWGDIAQAFPKPEGALFPGLVPVLLALVGAAFDKTYVGPTFRWPVPNAPAWIIWLLRIAMVLHLVAAGVVLLYRRVVVDLGLFEISIGNATQMLLRAFVLALLIAAFSESARHRIRIFLRTRGFFAFALVAALWLSLGPSPRSLGVPIELAAPYGFLHDHVPGFDGLRVPARFAMIAVLMLAVLAGFGAAVLARWRHATLILTVVGVLAIAEAISLPMTVNGHDEPTEFTAPEPRIYRPARAPRIYTVVAEQPGSPVIAELPLGQFDYDRRAVYYSLVHRRPILNGYSGFFPLHYGQLTLALGNVPERPDIAVAALAENGATHVLVHEGAWRDDRGVRTTQALLASGAVEVFREGREVLLKLR
jgi:hypothetical protein